VVNKSAVRSPSCELGRGSTNGDEAPKDSECWADSLDPSDEIHVSRDMGERELVGRSRLARDDDELFVEDDVLTRSSEALNHDVVAYPRDATEEGHGTGPIDRHDRRGVIELAPRAEVSARSWLGARANVDEPDVRIASCRRMEREIPTRGLGPIDGETRRRGLVFYIDV